MSDYLYLTSFYNTSTNGGVDQFEIDLITDHPVPQTHTARFLSGSKGLGEIEGHLYVFIGKLEVQPIPVDHELNTLRLSRYESDPTINLLLVDFIELSLLPHPLSTYYKMTFGIDVDLDLYVDNPDGMILSYVADVLPPGITLNSQTSQLEGTFAGPVEDLTSSITISSRKNTIVLTIVFQVRAADYVGIGEMEIGNDFYVY